MSTPLDAATLRALIDEAQNEASSRSNFFGCESTGTLWTLRAAWLQRKLNALPKEPPTSHTWDTECPMCGFKITVQLSAPRIPPDLAGALLEWRENHEAAVRYGFGLERERVLAAAIDAARARGEL